MKRSDRECTYFLAISRTNFPEWLLREQKRFSSNSGAVENGSISPLYM